MAAVREWVEASGPTVEIAIQAALQELGLASRDEAIVEVISEGRSGILGSGWRAQDAIVKVMPKPAEQKRRRRRGGRGRTGENKAGAGSEVRSGERGRRNGDDERRRSESRGEGRKGGSTRDDKDRRKRDQHGRSSGRSERPQLDGRSERNRRRNTEPATHEGRNDSEEEMGPSSGEEASIEEQAVVAGDFVRGLLNAFGLDGEVTANIEDDILHIDVVGDQTEALVGRKGVIMQSVLEITRTVVQRKTFGAPRMRIDINGYAERRREALRIYANRQAQRVLEEGGEVMLEPMNSADRKVVHDAVAEIAGVQSYSEGEDPDRAVVISRSEV